MFKKTNNLLRFCVVNYIMYSSGYDVKIKIYFPCYINQNVNQNFFLSIYVKIY